MFWSDLQTFLSYTSSYFGEMNRDEFVGGQRKHLNWVTHFQREIFQGLRKYMQTSDFNIV